MTEDNFRFGPGASNFIYSVWREGGMFRATCEEFPGIEASGLTHDGALEELNMSIDAALMEIPTDMGGDEMVTLPLFAMEAL